VQAPFSLRVRIVARAAMHLVLTLALLRAAAANFTG
jgi:hypothetical protein